MSAPLARCPRRGAPHGPHPIRLYFAPGVVRTTCPGLTDEAWVATEVAAGRACGAHDRALPCIECAS
jgi:hypothetical protein